MKCFPSPNTVCSWKFQYFNKYCVRLFYLIKFIFINEILEVKKHLWTKGHGNWLLLRDLFNHTQVKSNVLITSWEKNKSVWMKVTRYTQWIKHVLVFKKIVECRLKNTYIWKPVLNEHYAAPYNSMYIVIFEL